MEWTTLSGRGNPAPTVILWSTRMKFVVILFVTKNKGGGLSKVLNRF